MVMVVVAAAVIEKSWAGEAFQAQKVVNGERACGALPR